MATCNQLFCLVTLYAYAWIQKAGRILPVVAFEGVGDSRGNRGGAWSAARCREYSDPIRTNDASIMMDGGDLQNVVVRTETETAQVARAGAPMSNDVCASAADDKTCIICMSDPRGVRWSPCGHANSCEACALKLIQHALRKRLQCPECKQTVERLESQSIAQSEVPIARQPSFTSLADQPSSSSSKLLTVDEYLEAELKSADPDRAALAKEAKTHWNDVPSPGEMPWPAALSGGAGLMLPLRPWPFARTVTIVLSIGLMVGYVWGCTTVFFAADEFDDYLATQERWDVKVTQVDGFEGPVRWTIAALATPRATGCMAPTLPPRLTSSASRPQPSLALSLSLPCDCTCTCARLAQVTALIPHGRRCGVTFAQCVRALPDPTKHQRWWGLVPNEEVGVVREGIEGLRRARRWLFYLTLFTGSSAVSQPLVCQTQPTTRTLILAVTTIGATRAQARVAVPPCPRLLPCHRIGA